MKRFSGSNRMLSVIGTLAVVAIFVTSVFPGTSHAEEKEKKLGWFFTTEFGWVWTAGNSESNTFSLGATARRVWNTSELKLELGGTRTESSIKSRTAVGTSPDDFVVQEEKRTEKTAELYYARGRYEYKISKYFLAFGGIDWLRNQFSGIESRFLLAAGAGNTWVDKETIRLLTDYGVTYTFEEEVVSNPFVENNFPGLRAGYDFWWKLTETTNFASILVADWNLDNTDDIRIDFRNELPVSISDKLKLKPALQLLWRKDPALTEIDLVAADGTPTGDKVLVPLEELDTILKVTLVWEM